MDSKIILHQIHMYKAKDFFFLDNSVDTTQIMSKISAEKIEID